MNILTWLLMAGMLVYFAYFKGWIFNDFENISPQEAQALLSQDNDILLLDVRDRKAFKKYRLAGAISVPLEQVVDTNISNNNLLVYSERGESSVKASRILTERGFKVQNLEGGLVFWTRAGYKLQKTQ